MDIRRCNNLESEIRLLCNFFDHIIISEEVGHQKPAREIFDYAFEKVWDYG